MLSMQYFISFCKIHKSYILGSVKEKTGDAVFYVFFSSAIQPYSREKKCFERMTKQDKTFAVLVTWGFSR